MMSGGSQIPEAAEALRLQSSHKRASRRPRDGPLTLAQPWTGDPEVAGTVYVNDTATSEIYTLSLHHALPISLRLHGYYPRTNELRGGHAMVHSPSLSLGLATLRLQEPRKGSF